MINFITTADQWMASYRYRIQCVQNQLLLEGVEVRVTPYFSLEASICVYSKHLMPSDYSDALGAKALGKRVVFDVCDDHSETRYADHYARMIGLADTVTCNSEAMRKRIWEVYQRKAHVIPDPILHDPIDREPDLTKWLWFGAQWNMQPLMDSLDLIADRELEICTGPIAPIIRPKTTITEWSVDEISRAFLRNGVAFIPYEEEGACKSANRVLEALNASLVVVTNGIPATKELEPFIESHPSHVGPQSIAKMKAGRQYARSKYSQKAIVKKWKRVFDET